MRLLPALLPLLCLFLSACTTADPARVARAVEATLTAYPTPTPIVVVVTSVASQVEIVTAQASPTPGPEATPEPSPAPTQTQAAPVPVGDLIFEDDFAERGEWFLGEEDEFQRAAIAEGQLSITLKVPDRFALIFNTRRRARDFYASVRAASSDCQFRDRYGLLFRLQDDLNYYQFDVDCDGRYRVSKVIGGTLTPLRDWTAHPAIRAGGEAANQLGVRARGSLIEVFANAESLGQVSDLVFPEGGFGLYAGSGPQSPSFTAELDDLSVWEDISP